MAKKSKSFWTGYNKSALVVAGLIVVTFLIFLTACETQSKTQQIRVHYEDEGSGTFYNPKMGTSSEREWEQICASTIIAQHPQYDLGDVVLDTCSTSGHQYGYRADGQEVLQSLDCECDVYLSR